MEMLNRCGFYWAFVLYINQNQNLANVKTLQIIFQSITLALLSMNNTLEKSL